MVKTYNNIIFMVKLLVVKKACEKTLGCILGDNSENTNINLFRKKIVVLAGDIFLKNNIG